MSFFLQWYYYLLKTSDRRYPTPKCGVRCLVFFAPIFFATFFFSKGTAYQNWAVTWMTVTSRHWFCLEVSIRRFWPFQWSLISWDSIITPSRSWCWADIWRSRFFFKEPVTVVFRWAIVEGVSVNETPEICPEISSGELWSGVGLGVELFDPCYASPPMT